MLIHEQRQMQYFPKKNVSILLLRRSSKMEEIRRKLFDIQMETLFHFSLAIKTQNRSIALISICLIHLNIDLHAWYQCD